jgi:putative ABC transport system permease protein
MHDFRYALRSLAKSPGFTAVAVLTLALGIGANTAIFSVVYGVLLQPLPYPEQERLIAISEWSEQVPGMSVSYPNFVDWRTRQTSFSTLGVSRGQSFNRVSEAGSERVNGAMVTHDLLTTLGLPALRGRLFNRDDDAAGAERTVVIGESYWRRNFAGRDAAIGAKLQLDGERYTVVGVLPEVTQFPGGTPELWVPLGLWGDQSMLTKRWNHPGLYALARLKPGVPFAAAQTEMKAIAAQLAREHPATNTGNSVTLQLLTDRLFGSVRTALWVLLGAAGFVLLIACANVANLQLARAQARAREFSIRAALGAGRARLVRQLLIESLVLGLLGCIAGLLLGGWGLDALRAAMPADLPRLQEVALNGWVLAFAIGVSVLTSVGFGLVPATQAARQDLRTALSASPRTGGAASGRRWQAILIVGEFALTCLLLVGTSLMLRTLANLHRADPGYATEHILTFDFNLSGPAYRETAPRTALLSAALERLATVPGVKHVAFVNPLPLRGGNQSTYYLEGTPVPDSGRAPSAERIQVNGDYFAALGIPLLAGRTFGSMDAENAPRVAVVDTLFVEKHFPGKNPLGQRFAYGEKAPAQETDWLLIVGVVGHIQNYGLREATREQTYVALRQNVPTGGSFVVRSERDPAALTSSLRAAMREVAGELPVFNFRTMDDRFSASLATERLTVLLLGVFAALALMLAAVGLFGLLSYLVGQRIREIGVRMALGASPGAVVGLVVRHGLRLAGVGLLFGLAAALALTQLLRGLLYHVSPFDPVSFLAVALVLAAIGALACWLPARRATRIDPLEALRTE